MRIPTKAKSLIWNKFPRWKHINKYLLQEDKSPYMCSQITTKLMQEMGNVLSVCAVNILPKASSLSILLNINLMKVEKQIFQTVMGPPIGHLIKQSCLGAFYIKWTPCLVWCPCYFCWWYYVFYLSRDPTRPLHWGVMNTWIFMGESSSQHVITLKSWLF